MFHIGVAAIDHQQKGGLARRHQIQQEHQHGDHQAGDDGNGIQPAPHTMPMLMLQNRNTRSMGSFTALRKRTMDSAPTMPRLITMLLCMASTMAAVITGIRASALLKSRAVKGVAAGQPVHHIQIHAQQVVMPSTTASAAG